MARSSRRRGSRDLPGEPKRRSSRPFDWKVFGLALGKAAGGLALITIALVFCAAVIEFPVVDAEGALEVITAIVIGLVVLVGAFFVAGWAVLDLGEDLAIGWVGLLTGEVPQRFSRREPNAEKAAAHAVTLGVLLGLGAVVFVGGVRDVELHLAIEGLLLALAALIYGLAPLIPRVVYWRRDRGATFDEPEEKNPRAAIFMMLAVLGLGLAMGTDSLAWHLRGDSGHVVLPYGDWFERFAIGSEGERVTLELRPRSTSLVRVESYGCEVKGLKAADGAKVKLLSRTQMKKRGVVAPDESMKLVAFEAQAGARYQAWIPNEVCTVRYRRHAGEAVSE